MSTNLYIVGKLAILKNQSNNKTVIIQKKYMMEKFHITRAFFLYFKALKRTEGELYIITNPLQNHTCTLAY